MQLALESGQPGALALDEGRQVEQRVLQGLHVPGQAGDSSPLCLLLPGAPCAALAHGGTQGQQPAVCFPASALRPLNPGLEVAQLVLHSRLRLVKRQGQGLALTGQAPEPGLNVEGQVVVAGDDLQVCQGHLLEPLKLRRGHRWPRGAWSSGKLSEVTDLYHQLPLPSSQLQDDPRPALHGPPLPAATLFTPLVRAGCLCGDQSGEGLGS